MGSGIRAEQLQIDWPELMRFKRTFTGPLPRNREDAFVKAGGATFHGRARFVGPSTVQVGQEVLEGRYVVIAAGQKPADLKIPGVEQLTTSEQFLELDELPGRILFIGGGYIGFELPMWRRVLDRKSRLCIVVRAPFHDSIPIWSIKS